MLKFVTSMSADGYELYGKEFLESAREFLPGDLTVYTESGVPKNTHEASWRDLREVPGYTHFVDGVSRFPAANGMISGSYNYRMNVARFCNKSFAQIDYAASANDQAFWWIDSDVTFHRRIPESFFENMLSGVFLAYLGRPKWHSCLSLAGFDNRHDDAARFWANYQLLYNTGQVLLLPEWHDSYIVDFLRENLNIHSRNMSNGFQIGDGPANVFDVVLGEYAHHKKGNLKNHERKPSAGRYAQLIDIVRERQPKTVLEVGTWNGDRAVEMAMVAPGLAYFGVDLFEFANAESDEREKNVKPHYSAREVMAKLDSVDEIGKAHLYVGDSNIVLAEMAKSHADGTMDLIFIDGGHSVETIRSDLKHAIRLVSSDGIIVLDDWYEGGIDTERFGCNLPLEETCKGKYEVLPIADPVKGGGTTQMAVIRNS